MKTIICSKPLTTAELKSIFSAIFDESKAPFNLEPGQDFGHVEQMISAGLTLQSLYDFADSDDKKIIERVVNSQVFEIEYFVALPDWALVKDASLTHIRIITDPIADERANNDLTGGNVSHRYVPYKAAFHASETMQALIDAKWILEKIGKSIETKSGGFSEWVVSNQLEAVTKRVNEAIDKIQK